MPLAARVEMQEAVGAINAPIAPERRLELRIGVNLGDVIVDSDNIFGDGVNIAARLEALAQPGTVCISHTVYEQVKNKLDLDYRSLGNHRVKNIAEPVRVYAVGAPQSPRTRSTDGNSPSPRHSRGRRCALCRRAFSFGHFTRAVVVNSSEPPLRRMPRKSRALPLRLGSRGAPR